MHLINFKTQKSKKHIHLEFFHSRDISDGLHGSVSGLSELIVSNRW